MSDRRVAISLDRPDVSGIPAVISALADWQREGAVMQLHPGDVGWLWRFGADAAAAAVRAWSRDGRIVAAGILDGPSLLRMTIDPDARPDRELTDRLVADLADPRRGVLPAGPVSVEAPMDALLQDALLAAGWVPDEEWTPLRRDLAEPVVPPPLRIEVTTADRAADVSTCSAEPSSGRRSPSRRGTRWPAVPPTPTPAAWSPTTGTAPPSRA